MKNTETLSFKYSSSGEIRQNSLYRKFKDKAIASQHVESDEDHTVNDVISRIPILASVRWRQDEGLQTIVREHHMTQNGSPHNICNRINLCAMHKMKLLCIAERKSFVPTGQLIYIDLRKINDTS